MGEHLSLHPSIGIRRPWVERGESPVRDHIWKRVLEVGEYILESKETVRDTAKRFGVSKSTVHKDVTERLPKINPQLAEKVRQVLESNKAERHLRGGEATRQKFLRRSS
jgi:putative DeoR family transcriptional regulator (stage III sporulation protein D)